MTIMRNSIQQNKENSYFIRIALSFYRSILHAEHALNSKNAQGKRKKKKKGLW